MFNTKEQRPDNFDTLQRSFWFSKYFHVQLYNESYTISGLGHVGAVRAERQSYGPIFWLQLQFILAPQQVTLGPVRAPRMPEGSQIQVFKGERKLLELDFNQSTTQQAFTGPLLCLRVHVFSTLRLPLGLSGKEPTCQSRRCRFDPLIRKIPGRREWQPSPVFST